MIEILNMQIRKYFFSSLLDQTIIIITELIHIFMDLLIHLFPFLCYQKLIFIYQHYQLYQIMLQIHIIISFQLFLLFIYIFLNMWDKISQQMNDSTSWIKQLQKHDADRVRSGVNDSYNLPVGGTLVSANKCYFALLKEDGNFVIYVSEHFVNSNIVWQTNTANKGVGPFRFAVQNDCNLVIYDKNNTPTWNSGTSGKGNAPYTLLLRNNGNLQLYGAMGKMQWSSNSARN